MFGLGMGELLVILVIVVLVFGVGRIPELGSALGEGIKNFKKGYRESKSIDVSPGSQNSPTQNTSNSNESKN